MFWKQLGLLGADRIDSVVASGQSDQKVWVKSRPKYIKKFPKVY